MSTPLILASASPRRHELLTRAGLEFQVVHPNAEEIHDSALGPALLCETNAAIKARAVAQEHPDAVVLAADTLVFLDGEALGKPDDMEQAHAMIRRLAGRDHLVCTGVCMIFPGAAAAEQFHDTSTVVFHALEDDAIAEYLRLTSPLDKAGAYGIQDHGERVVSRIDGSMENVMGLPVDKVIAVLMDRGFLQL
ncbi:MAG: Maf family protein [Luteolibacter sp.]